MYIILLSYTLTLYYNIAILVHNIISSDERKTALLRRQRRPPWRDNNIIIYSLRYIIGVEKNRVAKTQ